MGKAISCKLTTPELQKHKTEVIAVLKNEVLEKIELENGYKYSFKGSDKMIDCIVSFIKTERACCGFFNFNLLIESVNTDILLTIAGPEGAKEFINTEMGL